METHPSFITARRMLVLTVNRGAVRACNACRANALLQRVNIACRRPARLTASNSPMRCRSGLAVLQVGRLTALIQRLAELLRMQIRPNILALQKINQKNKKPQINGANLCFLLSVQIAGPSICKVRPNGARRKCWDVEVMIFGI